MTKSEIFKAAHKLAKSVVAIVGDYMVALSYSLKKVYEDMKNTAIDFYTLTADVVETNGYPLAKCERFVKRVRRYCSDVRGVVDGVDDVEDTYYEMAERFEMPSELVEQKAELEKIGFVFNF